MKRFFLILFIASAFSSNSQIKIKGLVNKDSLAKKTKILKNTGTGSLTNEEVVRGLKEALELGTNKSSDLASKLDGYYKTRDYSFPGPKRQKK